MAAIWPHSRNDRVQKSIKMKIIQFVGFQRRRGFAIIKPENGIPKPERRPPDGTV